MEPSISPYPNVTHAGAPCSRHAGGRGEKAAGSERGMQHVTCGLRCAHCHPVPTKSCSSIIHLAAQQRGALPESEVICADLAGRGLQPPRLRLRRPDAARDVLGAM